MRQLKLVAFLLFSIGIATQSYAQKDPATRLNCAAKAVPALEKKGDDDAWKAAIEELKDAKCADMLAALAIPDDLETIPVDAKRRAMVAAEAIPNDAERAVAVGQVKRSSEQRRDYIKGASEFAGINFGVGISLTFDLGDHGRVEDASIVDGIVRVNDENDKIARIMLESHYFFTPRGRFMKIDNLHSGNWGWGPFVALQPGTNDIIEAIAVGLMIGFRRPDDIKGSSWNVGIGYVTDPNVRILADGFVENQPPPGNETEVRFKEISQDGVVLLFSFSF